MDQQQPEWPHGPCAPKKVYVMDTPFDQRVIIMSEASWNEYGTMTENMKAMLKKQDERIRELVGEIAVAKQIAADSTQRLENLREARRNEKRRDIEGSGIVVPGDKNFKIDLFNTRK